MARGERARLPAELTRQRLARARRGALRRWWLRNRAVVAATAAVATLVLGLWGFSESVDTRGRGVGGLADRVYRTIGLFGFAGSPEHLNWQLQVARVLAPVVVGYAALSALIALFRQQAQLARVRLFARRHVVVCGLGERGFLLATGLREAQLFVVVVERDAANRFLAGLRERGIPVIVGDARDPEVLAQARCDRARHIVCCAASDATNLDVLAACADLADRRGWRPATVHVLLESSALRSRLRRLAVGGRGRRDLRVDFAGLSDLSAKALLGASVDHFDPGAGPCSIIVNATTETGRQTALAAVRLAMAAGPAIRLVLIGPAADRDRQRLVADAPWVAVSARVEALVWDAAADATTPEALPRDTTVAFVCDADEALGLAQGVALTDHLRDAVVVVDVDDERVPRSLDRVGLELARVRPVGSAARVLGPALLLDTVTEVLARARHETYVRLERSRGGTPDTNPSLVAWDDLPESLKEANRRYADSVGNKLAALGARIVPLGPTDPLPGPMTLPEPLIESMAREEHDRWMNDLRADGWRPTTGAKDPEQKVHPLLVPWAELDEREQEKDRDSVLRLPELLAAAGYAIAFDRAPTAMDGSATAGVSP